GGGGGAGAADAADGHPLPGAQPVVGGGDDDRGPGHRRIDIGDGAADADERAGAAKGGSADQVERVGRDALDVERPGDAADVDRDPLAVDQAVAGAGDGGAGGGRDQAGPDRRLDHERPLAAAVDV